MTSPKPSEQDRNRLRAEEYCRHGQEMYAGGKREEALQAFQTALEIHPECALAYNNLGVVALEVGDLDGALNFFQQALTINPKHHDTLQNIKALIGMKGDAAEGPVAMQADPANAGKTLVVMGNGPSLKQIDFELLRRVDTFGLNAAYRAYRRMNWWPTYHGCFDAVVTKSHLEEFQRLTLEENPIKGFFYLARLSDSPRLQTIKLIGYRSSEKWNQSPADFASFNDGGNSGVNACQVGICLGYRKILLVGVDCQYVEMVDGAKLEEGEVVVKMEKTPEANPNYWFDDYQQAGDQFNVPQKDVYHLPAWKEFALRAAHHGIEVINCSPGSKLDCFPHSTLEAELSHTPVS